MTTITIHSSTHEYEVEIGSGLRNQLAERLLKNYQTVLVITDTTVAGHYLNDITKHLSSVENLHTAVVPSGESSKSMEHYRSLLDQCIDAQLDRHSLIIALGGGMIGDLAGFVASTYLRGIDYIQMPTSILAHDSSVGGKVAINHPKGKNLIGSFYNPKQVIYDVETLKSLPEREIRSGYGEVIKHAFLSDESWVKNLLQQSLKDLTSQQLKQDLTKGVRVKASIVEEDEREAGIRKHLNLGHTLAHAIEAELGYGEITHGEAVAIGLLFTLQLSEIKNSAHLPIKDYVNWLEKNKYPTSIMTKLDPEQLLKRMKWDKKTVHQNINFVLLEKTGSPYVIQMGDEELVHELKRMISAR
ncbi:3-dehydroquinate synthase [Halobacillus litoralis]|uniref:3-dehydroquinate synthase n=1 Tax=Halobacillus litoralis TaxID=45668 RepID=A0A410M819_9BACI|nr:3-dehydroquinate synthase [Halobacillus litoralis]QAS50783.1 3-dehydroquinate synthase [Halobacillus litoralis]